MRTSGAISIAACAKRHDVDNRIGLGYYYRIARNLLKQADIYRAENNLIDLYIMLLRFSSLIAETIPCHKDYNLTLKHEKTYFITKLIEAISEMEGLKPVVQNRVEELNRKHRSQANKWKHKQQNVANTYCSSDYRSYDRKSSSSHNNGQVISTSKDLLEVEMKANHRVYGCALVILLFVIFIFLLYYLIVNAHGRMLRLRSN